MANDIYIDNGKVCGFLTEMVANNDGIEAIICGIGINLTQQLENFDESIRHRATSIQLHDKNKLDRYQFLERLLQEIEKRYNQFLTLPFLKLVKNILQLLIFGIERCYLQKMINSLKDKQLI